MEAVKRGGNSKSRRYHTSSRCAHSLPFNRLCMIFQLLTPQFWATPRFLFPLLITLNSGERMSRDKTHPTTTTVFSMALSRSYALSQLQPAFSNTQLGDFPRADCWLTKPTHSINKVHEPLQTFHQTWLLYLMSLSKSQWNIFHTSMNSHVSGKIHLWEELSVC